MDLSRMPGRLCARFLVSAVLVLASASVGHAQAAPDNDGWSAPAHNEPAPKPREKRQKPAAPGVDHDRQAARALLDAGTIAYRQQRFEDALQNFQQAYKLTNDPLLLFNIGLAYERLLRLPEAVEALEDYLAAMPDAPNRPAAEERIRIMREHIQESAPPPPPVEPEPEVAPPPPPPPPPVDRGLRVLPTWAFWSGLGATAVLGGVTIWSGVDTQSAHDAYEKNPTPKKRDAGQSAQLRTNVLIATTGVFAVATAVVGVFFTDWKGEGESGEAPRTAFAPRLERDAVGLTMTRSF